MFRLLIISFTIPFKQLFPCTKLKLQNQKDCTCKVSRTHLSAELAKSSKSAVVNIMCIITLKDGNGLGRALVGSEANSKQNP